ncbi:hypothetical protein H1215_11170, partial [Anoxybacillus sp. LAT_38]|nr:hypothetical protein [Anoxybacillus sp. LAT_38]
MLVIMGLALFMRVKMFVRHPIMFVLMHVDFPFLIGKEACDAQVNKHDTDKELQRHCHFFGDSVLYEKEYHADDKKRGGM